jgi:hypothetical protein
MKVGRGFYLPTFDHKAVVISITHFSFSATLKILTGLSFPFKSIVPIGSTLNRGMQVPFLILPLPPLLHNLSLIRL